MSSGKLIARNTSFLYLRMGLAMIVNLYASRVILDVLGVQDYGIYTVVGGVVALFGFLNSAMSSGTQRYLATDIGRGDDHKLLKTFNITLIVHVMIAVFVLLLAESIGLFFLNYKLKIPYERLGSANFVYQFSILACIIGIIQVPFNALIIVREKMGIFAAIGFLEVVLRLLIVYLLQLSSYDKLKTYSILIVVVSLLVSTLYKLYCWKRFKESHFRWFYDKSYMLNILSFSGWNLFGSIAFVAKGQGVNILLNLFFGTVLNAAYGIMIQFQNAINQFVSNFQMALTPQIIKTYASGESEKFFRIVFVSCKYSYYMVFILICPIFINTKSILDIWLTSVPVYTEIFIKLCLIEMMIESISGPLKKAVQASGKVKWYQIILGSFIFLILPISYLALKMGALPVTIFYISVAVSLISFIVRLIFMKHLIELDVKRFLKEVVVPIFITSAISILLIAIFIKYLVSTSIISLIIISGLICLLNILIFFFFGTSRSERSTLKNFIYERRTKAIS